MEKFEVFKSLYTFMDNAQKCSSVALSRPLFVKIRAQEDFPH
jgi:hypothetical protein